MTDKECLNKIQDIVDGYMWDEDADGVASMDMIIKVLLQRDKPYENSIISAIRENNAIADQRPDIDFSGTKYDI